MLKSLEVKDYALIEHIQAEFGKGLNIITGETGTGKSILIDALGLLLGERASTEVIRKGAAKSIVEGIFEVKGNKKVEAVLSENDIEFYPELIMRREISLKGSNRCFLNDTPVQLSVIKETGNLLVDLHGQHEHQSLLRTETHIDYLDELGNYDDLLQKYLVSYNELDRIKHELETLKKREATLKERKDIVDFQIKEIDAVSPEEDEDVKLNEQLKILENSETLAELTSEIYQVLYESENSVHDAIVKIRNDLIKLNGIDKTFEESVKEIESVLTLINDISSSVNSYASKVELDPEHIEGVRERLSAINILKKKYGGSINSVLEQRKKLAEEADLVENFSGKISELETQLDELRKEAGTIALEISKKRNEMAKKIKRNIEDSLKQLGIQYPDFKTVISNDISTNENFVIANNKRYQYYGKGIDKVEFFISTNKGEDPKPLAKVASGGEISRIMLSLKSTLAKADKLPLLIFDEIDVGVSGRIAQKVGQSLKELSRYHQVIAITHLPQIAGMANLHYLIEKITKGARVISSIKRLKDSERVTEVAKLLSGEKVTESSLESARQLIEFKE